MSLAQTLQYSPSDCFETFAFPDGLWRTPSAGLAEIGERYHEHRRKLMLSLWLGLTDVYNLFHSREVEGDLAKHFASRAKKDPRGELIPEEHRAGAVSFTPEQALAGILELRRLHVELDVCVRDAYGWHDLPLEHDFHAVETLPENDRVRYTISAAARKELLKRLLAENHRRAATETASTPAIQKQPARRPPPTVPSPLFDEPAPSPFRLPRLVRPQPAERYVTCLPLVPLKAAAGAFGDPQHIPEDSAWEDWVAVDTGRTLRPGMFVAQVVGRSMEPNIPDGAYCVFAAPVTGSRQGRIVLVQLRDQRDPENGERYTVKRYESEKSTGADGVWRHVTITLHPLNRAFQPIVLSAAEEGEVSVIAEFVQVL